MKTSFMILIFISLLSISGIKSIAYADAVVDKEFVWRTDEEVMAIYEKWMLEHDKVYNGLREEKLKRFEIFKDNLKYIEEHNNLLNQTYKLGLNQFSDLTLDEFKSIYLINTPIDTLNESEIDFSYIPELNYSLRLPDSIDWRKQGAVVPIKDQGSCGSCWAFSAISAVEALNKIKRGVLISLSEQMLVDCVKRATYGCNGGRQTDAFQYMTDHGIASSGDYPYKQVQGPTCQNNKIVVKLGGYRNIVPRREDYLQLITSMQVVSVMVKSGSKDFQHYKSGIFSGKCGDEVDHAVTVVGYGSENGNAYWIVRNSWATTWGEQGYMRMPRNIKNDEGYCGIALWPSFPVMNSIHEGNINIL